MRKGVIAPLVACALSLSLVLSAFAGFGDSLDFGAPSAPQSINPPDLRITYHYDENSFGGRGFDVMQADHGPDCSAPPISGSGQPPSHTIGTNFPDSVFACKNHLMTAAYGGGGYGEITMQPNQLLDISGQGTIDWNVSTQGESARDWWAVSVMAVGQELQVPVTNPALGVDGVGPALNALTFAVDNGPGGMDQTFRTEYVTNGNIISGPDGNFFLSEKVPPSAAVRTHFRMVVSKGHVTVSLPDVAGAPVAVDGPINLNFNQGVVSFEHHSYNPTKDNSGVPATWHWSNFALNPAIPYTVIKANEPLLGNVNTPQAFTFPQSAPTQAFATWQMDGGQATSEQASFDGGQSWQKAVQQCGTQGCAGDDHLRQSHMPIPAGTTSFMVKADGGYARDAAIISYSGVSIGTPVPTSTPVPTAVITSTPVPTAVPPTSTPVPTAVPPTSTPVPTVVITSTPAATTTSVPVTSTPGTRISQTLYRGDSDQVICAEGTLKISSRTTKSAVLTCS